MKPLFHPALADITVEGIMHALSDPVRAAIYAELADAADALTCSTFLTVRDRDIPKSTLSQHFKTLRDAGLILSERQGVEMKSISRCKEIETRFPGLIPAIMGAHKIQLMGKKKAAARRKPAGT
ncbi:MAG: helix-turn-helix transcriptional regulator [Betaproteobacteria bacterium]|nr:helix-turn-helix transcriptional regulator [Betaproteobacteria bacterium]